VHGPVALMNNGGIKLGTE